MTYALILAAALGWTGLEPDSHIGGRKLSEGYMQGKVALVCRWGLDSQESRESVSRLEHVWQSYKSKPLVILGSLTEGSGSPAKAKTFVKSKGISYSVYSGAGLEKGAPVFEKVPYFYVIDASGKMVYKGSDERRAEEAIVQALTNYASPPDADYWSRLIDSEIEVLPGRAYMHLNEFRKLFPGESKAYDDRFKALKARSEVVKMAQLETFAAKVRDFDPNESKSNLQSMLSKLKSASKAYEPFKGHSDPFIAQEAKNCLADLKWAEIALKAHVGK